MTRRRAREATAGLVLFVALSFLGSWFVAAALRVFALNVQPGPLGTRLFATSLLYAVTMGWQPAVATWVVRRWVDPPDQLDVGLRSTRGVFSVAGVLGALAVAASATAIAWAAVAAGVLDRATFNGAAEAPLPASPPHAEGLLPMAAAFAGTLILVWTQAFSEEIGWRGYFLPRLMELLGSWRGLLLHGAAWGLWYAPVLFFSTYGPQAAFGSAERSLGFVVTCMLLGTLLGWLRLASRSVMPVVLANAVLTLAAGLPYVIHGIDAGLRSAVYGPVGWLVLVVAITALAASRWRAAVRVPDPLILQPGAGAAPPARLWLVRRHRPPPGGPRSLN